MTAPTLSTLLDRLRAASGQFSRVEAHRLVVGLRPGHALALHEPDLVDALTGDLNAALALVQARLPGCRIDLIIEKPATHAVIYFDAGAAGTDFREGEAPTPALALLATLLAALIAEGMG